MLRFRPLSYFGVSPVGFKPTTLSRPDPYSGAVIQLRFMETLAQTEGFEPPTFAFGEQRSTPELSLH